MRLLLIVVLLLLAGCGGDTRPTAPFADPATAEPTAAPTEQPIEEPTPAPEARGEPTVTSQGFTVNAGLDAASYAVVIENPDAAAVPRFVSVMIRFLDAEGAVLASETQNVTGLFPESETAVAGEAADAGSATQMEVEISSLNILPNRIRSSLDETDRYEFERVETVPAEAGGMATTGIVRSSFETEQVNVPIHVVYYDSAGEVVGGAVTGVEQVPSGGQIAFEAQTSVTVPGVAETRVFGHIGFGD